MDSNVFEWDLLLLNINPQIYDNSYAGSKNINTENMFNSPDGLSFNKEGVLFIQTDGKYTNEGKYIGMGNNQMLIARATNWRNKKDFSRT